MTRDEFVAKFPVGSLVYRKSWLPDFHVKILYIVNYNFFAETVCADKMYEDGEEIYTFDYGWLLYEKKPKEKKLIPAHLFGELDKYHQSIGGKPAKIVIKNFKYETVSLGVQEATGELWFEVDG